MLLFEKLEEYKAKTISFDEFIAYIEQCLVDERNIWMYYHAASNYRIYFLSALVQLNDQQIFDWLSQKCLDHRKKNNESNYNLIFTSLNQGDTQLFDYLDNHYPNELSEILNKKSSNDDTAFHILADTNKEIFKRIIKYLGVSDIDSPNKSGQRPIHVAAEKGNLDVMEFLLAYQINPAKPDNSGLYPVHIAARHGYQNVLILLEKYGANLHQSNKHGRTPLMVAFSEKKYSTVHYLLLKNQNFIQDFIDNVDYPMHWAARNGYVDIIKLLEQNGLDINERMKDRIRDDRDSFRHSKDRSRDTPFMKAVLSNQIEVVKYLLSKNAELANQSNRQGYYPANYAVENGHWEMAELLLNNGADFKQLVRGGRNDSFLMAAVEHNQIKFVKNFLQKSKNGLNRANKEGFYPIHIAALKEHRDMFKLLLEHKVNINQKITDKTGDTLLIRLIRKKQPEFIDYLLTFPEVEIETANDEGWYPVHMAAYEGDLQTLKTLIGRGANICHRTKDGYSETPLMISVRKNQLESAQYLFTLFGVNPNEPNGQGWYPIHMAAKNGNWQMITLLVKHGADINQEANNETADIPLMKAIQNKQLQLIKNFFSSYKINVNFRNKKGLYPVHEAVIAESREILILLLNQGANINQPQANQKAETPLMTAINRQKNKIANDIMRILLGSRYQLIRPLLLNITILSDIKSHELVIQNLISNIVNFKPKTSSENSQFRYQTIPLLLPIQRGGIQTFAKNKKLKDYFERPNSFITALSIVLNDIQEVCNKSDIYLKKICYNYYVENESQVNLWYKNAGGKPDWQNHDNYLVTLNVEGKILCCELELDAICVIEKLKNPKTENESVSYQLITKEGYRTLTELEIEPWLHNQKIPKLEFRKDSQTFSPVLIFSSKVNNLTSKRFTQFSCTLEVLNLFGLNALDQQIDLQLILKIYENSLSTHLDSLLTFFMIFFPKKYAELVNLVEKKCYESGYNLLETSRFYPLGCLIGKKEISEGLYRYIQKRKNILVFGMQLPYPELLQQNYSKPESLSDTRFTPEYLIWLLRVVAAYLCAEDAFIEKSLKNILYTAFLVLLDKGFKIFSLEPKEQEKQLGSIVDNLLSLIKQVLAFSELDFDQEKILKEKYLKFYTYQRNFPTLEILVIKRLVEMKEDINFSDVEHGIPELILEKCREKIKSLPAANSVAGVRELMRFNNIFKVEATAGEGNNVAVCENNEIIDLPSSKRQKLN